MYLYLKDAYRNGSSATRLSTSSVAEVNYVTFLFDPFLRAVQYSPVSRFAHNQMMNVCKGTSFCCGYYGGWSVSGLVSDF